MSVSKDMKCPHSGGSRPSDKGGGGGRGRTQKKFFWPLGPQSGLKIWGGGAGPPGPSPGSITGTFWAIKLVKLI